uniref:OSJNBa0029H02.7 protein n=1 Tax=Oryza sativa subsp. japonica TaxID=39947 RepID=Q7XT81_ORYSJ|nr:OSJNBa0029H02.7 [Oryza sativa Japonica Group]
MTRGKKGMQPKISAFFKRQAPEPETSRFFILVPSSNLLAVAIRGGDTHREGTCGMEVKRPKSCADGKVLNKKRNYAQFHLELGQPDFLLHMCSVCGMMYARGNDDDEKAHKAYHKSYFEGVPFKGWRNETVVARSEGGDRIILVTDENSCARNSKVQEVIKVVQKELGFGEGQLLHKLCKVYLFISSQRIVGCLVAEPIKTAHKVIPGSTEENGTDLPVDKIEPVKTNHTLEFGKISFKREVLKRHDHSDKNKEEYRDPGAIICEKEDVPAHCGFRAIWVVPSRRRKRIGSQLMDAASCSLLCSASISKSLILSYLAKALSIRLLQEKLPRRRDFVHLTVRFLTAYFLREGAGTQLLQDQRILSLQGARCIGDAAEDVTYLKLLFPL